MPSFKLWFLSAVLSAIVFPPSTVFADDVPADEGIVGSWEFSLALDSERMSAAKDPEDRKAAKEAAIAVKVTADGQRLGFTSFEFRADGTFTYSNKFEGTWKLLNKRGRKPELTLKTMWEGEGEGKEDIGSVTWINEDQFIHEFSKDAMEKVKEGIPLRFIKGFHFHRKKDAPKP